MTRTTIADVLREGRRSALMGRDAELGLKNRERSAEPHGAAGVDGLGVDV